jgi:hypothetical protein
VRSGGERAAQNDLRFDPARCFGTAFERTEGAMDVRAPADAVVRGRESGRDGELLVLETAPGEYCVLAGLEPGSCAVTTASPVERGAHLGRAAGVLTVHLQDDPRPGEGEGIPLRYFRYRLDGRAVASGVPVPPQEVANEPEESAEELDGR